MTLGLSNCGLSAGNKRICYVMLTWKRRPGRPQRRWLDQIRIDSGLPPSTAWSAAIQRGHRSGVSLWPMLASRT